MKQLSILVLVLVPFLPSFVQVGGSGGGGGQTHCIGCDDLTQDPQIIDLQVGSCVSYTTGSALVGFDGDCIWLSPGCSTEPCDPTIQLLHHQSNEGDGSTLDGIVGDIKIATKSPGGPSVEIFRGGTVLGCGSSSPYYFEIVGDCPETDSIEYVTGWFVCEACTFQ